MVRAFQWGILERRTKTNFAVHAQVHSKLLKRVKGCTIPILADSISPVNPERRLTRDLKELRKPWADPVCSKFTSNCGLLLILMARYSSIGVEMDCYLNAFILSMRSDAKILSP